MYLPISILKGGDGGGDKRSISHLLTDRGGGGERAREEMQRGRIDRVSYILCEHYWKKESCVILRERQK